jgi:hypothetical protein
VARLATFTRTGRAITLGSVARAIDDGGRRLAMREVMMVDPTGGF